MDYNYYRMTITIGFHGRLGNQLFQYAVLRNISIIKGYDLYVDTTYECQGQQNLLRFFNIAESSQIVAPFEYNYNQPNGSNYFDSNVYNIPDNTALRGYFENVQYFKENLEVIQNELIVKDQQVISFTDEYFRSISNDGTKKVIGIHFRRGDILQLLGGELVFKTLQSVLTVDEFNEKMKDYVRKTLEDIIIKTNKNITLLLFTGGIRPSEPVVDGTHHSHNEDIQWVDEFTHEYINEYSIHISPGTLENNELIDYRLLQMCDYIISPYQSTFSFMAYYTSKRCIQYFSLTNLYGGL